MQKTKRQWQCSRRKRQVHVCLWWSVQSAFSCPPTVDLLYLNYLFH